MNAVLSKNDVRPLLIAQRAKLTDRAEKSTQTCTRLSVWLQENIPQFSVVGIYHAISSELELNSLHQNLLQRYQLALPAVTRGVMSFYSWHPDQSLAPDDCQIPAPMTSAIDLVSLQKVSPIRPDVLIIPCVGVNLEGYRLGYGKGFYDRYCANYLGIRIGVAFNCQRIAFAQEAHDLRLDHLATEDDWLSFS